MIGSRSLFDGTVVVAVARVLAIILVWLVLLASIMAFFFSPAGAVPDPTVDELLGFAAAFTINGAVAASVALVIAGRRRWAVEVGMAVGLAIATAALLAYAALWAAPSTVRSLLDAWTFLRIRGAVLDSGWATAAFHAPLGAGVGGLVGGLAGTLIVLSTRRPKPAAWIALGVLAACASESVRAILSGAVLVWGMIIRRLFIPWPGAGEHVWATAAGLGAICGALLAFLSIHVTRSRRPGRVPDPVGAPGSAVSSPR